MATWMESEWFALVDSKTKRNKKMPIYARHWTTETDVRSEIVESDDDLWLWQNKREMTGNDKLFFNALCEDFFFAYFVSMAGQS